MTTAQLLTQINKEIEGSYFLGGILGAEEATLANPVQFYNAVNSFNQLRVGERDPLFLDYLDTYIKIHNLLTEFRTKPPRTSNVVVERYDYTIDTIELAKRRFGSYDAIGELYDMNSVSSDFELQSADVVILPNTSG